MADYNMQGVAGLSLEAGGTIRRNRLITQDSAGKAVEASAITNAILGVSLIDASSGQQVPIQTFGVAKVVASAAITLAAGGRQVMATASGDGKCSTAAGATARTVGLALEAAGADGDVIKVLLQLSLNQPPNS